MRIIANILWIILGGFALALGWVAAGILCCITIIGIPLGTQCFKFAALSLTPFGKTITYGGGAPSLIANIIWIIACGLPLAIAHAVIGAFWCITIIGIPLGLQAFKFAKLSLMPFGSTIS